LGLDAILTGSMDVILFCAGLIIWAMVLLLALDNLGIQIKPLLAGLGIGGIAIALAARPSSATSSRPCPSRSTSPSASATR